MSSQVAVTSAAALPVLLVWAAAVDMLTRTIPNALVVTLTASFIPFAVSSGMPALEIIQHAAGATTVLLGGYVLYSRALIGGGDAKLLAAAALWFGFRTLLPFLAAVALAGGCLSLAFMLARVIGPSLCRPLADRLTIPYAAAIATGGLAVLPDWLAAL